MIIDLIVSIIQKFIDLIEQFFEIVFGGVNFAVLWNWLPADIGAAASGLIIILFGMALITFVRRFLPF